MTRKTKKIGIVSVIVAASILAPIGINFWEIYSENDRSDRVPVMFGLANERDLKSYVELNYGQCGWGGYVVEIIDGIFSVEVVDYTSRNGTNACDNYENGLEKQRAFVGYYGSGTWFNLGNSDNHPNNTLAYAFKSLGNCGDTLSSCGGTATLKLWFVHGEVLDRKSITVELGKNISLGHYVDWYERWWTNHGHAWEWN